MATDVAPTPREMLTPIVGEYIFTTPGTCGGEPRIAGTRVKVRHVFVWVEQQGMSVAQVVETYPHLSRAAVHAALAYYWAHPDEIHRSLLAEDEFVAGLKAETGLSLVAGNSPPRGNGMARTIRFHLDGRPGRLGELRHAGVRVQQPRRGRQDWVAPDAGDQFRYPCR